MLSSTTLFAETTSLVASEFFGFEIRPGTVVGNPRVFGNPILGVADSGDCFRTCTGVRRADTAAMREGEREREREREMQVKNNSY